MWIQIIIIQLKFLNFYQNCEYFIFLFVISHLEQYSRRPGLHGINMLELLKEQEIQSNEGWARTYIKWLLTWRCWGISYFNILFNVAAGHQSLGWVHSQSMRDSLINGNGKLSFEETFNMLQYLLSKRLIYYFFVRDTSFRTICIFQNKCNRRLFA